MGPRPPHAACHFSHALDEVPFALRCLSQQLLAQPQLTSVLFPLLKRLGQHQFTKYVLPQSTASWLATTDTSAIRMKANGSSAFASCHFSNALDEVQFAQPQLAYLGPLGTQ